MSCLLDDRTYDGEVNDTINRCAGQWFIEQQYHTPVKQTVCRTVAKLWHVDALTTALSLAHCCCTAPLYRPSESLTPDCGRQSILCRFSRVCQTIYGLKVTFHLQSLLIHRLHWTENIAISVGRPVHSCSHCFPARQKVDTWLNSRKDVFLLLLFFFS